MKKILIADDNPAILEAVSLILEDVGYETYTVSDDKIIKQIVSIKPDLILLDIWLSGQDGREICKTLKNRNDTKNIPIIMISANKDTSIIAKEAGANDFLEKPFDMDDLLTKVASYMS